jgi:glutamate N-acetyltransferase/amino-acid N-acetyltransferase
MKVHFKEVPGAINAPTGFLASGVFCDIKRLGTGKGSDKGHKPDLALIVSEVPAAVVVNSGNANACTGKQGLSDAREMTRVAAAAVAANVSSWIPRSHERGYRLIEKYVLVGSTGRIGVVLPMENVKNGIREAAKLLGNSKAHADKAAEAIMTSDTRPKQIAVEFKLDGETVRLGGICKGAGMIQPGMSRTGRRPAATPLHATMLCFITTDAAIDARTLQTSLQEAVAQSFNRITVDGDMSTNDTVLVLANGMAGNRKFRVRSPEFGIFQAALNHVCLELAKMIVRDGEGVHRVVTVRVHGAKAIQDADAAARAVANSALVKTSWHGGDPNWGRIMDALGYSPAKIVEEKVDIGYSAPGSRKILWSLQRGQPTKATFRQLCAAVALKEYDLHIHLHLGQAGAVIYAADLTEEYVDFNKGDVGDPNSLGG